MALERVGLGALFTAETSGFVRGTSRARTELGRFVKASDRVPPPLARIGRAVTSLTARMRTMAAGVGRGVRSIAAGARNMAMGFAPVSIAMGAGFKAAADFEQQMSAVGAITRANTEDMLSLEKEARRMGIVSVFSAKQAGEGLEYLGRAGADPTESIAALSGVMNAAAADGIDLGTSANIVATVVKGMGKEWSEAGHIADSLALASASANTNISMLGEAFVYGSSTARTLKMSTEEVTSLFAKMADAGLKASLGGTAFSNMMDKLSKPTSKAQSILKKWKIELDNADGSMRKVASIAEDFSKKLQTVKSVTQQNAIATEVFGKRGKRAFSAIAAAGAQATLDLEESLIASSEGIGAAAEMATRRLDNIWGAATLLKSSLESLFIGIFKQLLEPMKVSVAGFVDALNSVLFIMVELETSLDGNIEGTKAWADAVTLLGEDGAKTAKSIAMGFADAARDIRDAWGWIVNKVKEIKKWLGDTFGDDGLRKLTRMITIAMMIAGALTPIILGLAMVKWAIGGLVSVLYGMATVVASVFWPLLIVLGSVYLAYQLLKRENESFSQTAIRVWKDIKVWALDVWHNVLKPIWYGIKDALGPAMEELGKIWGEVVAEIKIVFTDLYTFMFGGMEGIKVDWRDVGRVIGSIIATTAHVILWFVKYAIPLIATIASAMKSVFGVVWDVISAIIGHMSEGIAKFVVGFQEVFEGNIIQGLKRIGLAFFDLILTPLQLVIRGILAAAEAIPGVEAPSWLKTFAKEGLTGLVIGGTEGMKGRKTVGTRGAMLESIPGMAKRMTGAAPQIRGAGVGVASAAKIAASTSLMAKELTDWESYMKAKSFGETPEINTNVVLDDKRETNLNTEVCIDGEAVMRASSRHKQEIQDRAGFKSTPWQRRTALEHGAAPVRRAG